MTAARNNGPAADRRGSAWPVAPRETTARSDGYGSTWTERPAHGGGRSAEALDRDPVSGSGVSVGSAGRDARSGLEDGNRRRSDDADDAVFDIADDRPDPWTSHRAPWPSSPRPSSSDPEPHGYDTGGPGTVAHDTGGYSAAGSWSRRHGADHHPAGPSSSGGHHAGEQGVDGPPNRNVGLIQAPFVPPPPAPPPAPGVGLPTPREPAPAPPSDASDMVAIIRTSFEAVAPRADQLTQLFYGWLFQIAPETRDLFPVTMELQRSRLLRALVHVVQMVDRPDELTVFLRQLGRDHRKFGVVGEHYDKVGEALLGALGEIAGPLWTPEVEQAWVGAYGIVSQAMRDAADAEHGPAVWMARVMEHRRISPDLAVVRVQTGEPVPYLAGQYVSVEIPQRPRMWRSLTPANAPGPDCVIEFHVHTVPGGWVSRAIVSHAHVGDVWRIGPPMGQMTLDPHSRADLLMVAGGTGLTPARALIEQLMVDGSDRKVALFVGGRSWESLYDIDTLRRMAQDNPWLTVVPVVEEDGSRHGAETGTLGEVVARYGAWADRQIVVAGSPPMVRSTVSAMLDAGTPFMQIHYDPYHTD